MYAKGHGHPYRVREGTAEEALRRREETHSVSDPGQHIHQAMPIITHTRNVTSKVLPTNPITLAQSPGVRGLLYSVLEKGFFCWLLDKSVITIAMSKSQM